MIFFPIFFLGQDKICLDYVEKIEKSELILNGVSYGYETIYGINGDKISEVSRKIDKDKKKEYIIINTDKKYVPNLINLNDIAKEYNIKDNFYIVVINDRIMTGAYKSIYIDKGGILSVNTREVFFDKKKLILLSIRTY